MNLARWVGTVATGTGIWLLGATGVQDARLTLVATAMGSEPTLSESEQKRYRTIERWKREMERRTKGLLHADNEKITWGNERRAHQGVMIVFDPPLPKNAGPEIIEIDLFHRWIQNDSTTFGSIGNEGKNAVWAASLKGALGESDRYLPSGPNERPWPRTRIRRREEDREQVDVQRNVVPRV